MNAQQRLQLLRNKQKERDTESEKILREAVRMSALMQLYTENPGAFDFNSLSHSKKVALIRENYKEYKDRINVDLFPRDSKVDLFISKPNVFRKYINFEELNRTQLQSIAELRPSYFLKYDIPISSLNGNTWSILLKFDTDHYASLFIENIPRIRNKTDLRVVFTTKPYLLKLVTVDVAQASVLSAKEWILLTNWNYIRQYPVTYSDEMIEWLTLESSVEILAGSAASRQLKEAMKRITDLQLQRTQND
jgi:hypothetical protein